MYTVDASVWVNGFDPREPGYVHSRGLLDLLGDRNIPIVVPNLVLAEVAGAIRRIRNNPVPARTFVRALRNLPNVTFLPLDDALVQQAQELAANYGLRGADAVYAAVALISNCTLVSLDNEHLTRLKGVVVARKPVDILTELSLLPPHTS